MGLDAFVFCNCYETGKVKTPPPQPELVYVDAASGEVSIRCQEPGADPFLFDQWLLSACEHGPRMHCLCFHHLGNIAHIGFLRDLFRKAPDRFPTLLSKVVFDGTHSGDMLSLSEVEDVANEMSAVRALHCATASDEAILREFEVNMMELVQAAENCSQTDRVLSWQVLLQEKCRRRLTMAGLTPGAGSGDDSPHTSRCVTQD